jgi:serine/threonine protein kinase
MTDQPTNRVGDYEVLGTLGTGGMGSVFKVRNVITDRVEAMKTLLPNLAGRQDLADRFLREIKVLAALNHPNIAALRTAFTWENKLVMIMEYVEGVTLAARLEKSPIPPGEAVNYIDQALAGLGYAHAQHVIHRDIKPSNMMLTPEGVVKIMDFGIARSASDRTLTAVGTTLGSLYYMSPEQIKGEGVDNRSDLYSVGVSLYEMITGKRPFEADSDFSLMAAHLQKTPIPPVQLRGDLPAGLSEIMMRAMAKDPALRFQSAEDFRNAIKNFGTSGALAAPSNWLDISQQATQPMDALATATLPAHGTPPPPAREQPAATASTETPSWLPPQAPASATASVASQPAPTKSQSFTPVRPQTPPPAPPGSFAPPQPQIPPQQQAVPTPVSPAPVAKNRGLYISLGAVIVLVALVGAGLYGPLRNRIHASESNSISQPVTPGSSQPETSSQPAATPATSTQPANAPQPASNTGTISGQPTSMPPSNTGTGNATAAAPPPPTTVAPTPKPPATAHASRSVSAPHKAQASEQPEEAQPSSADTSGSAGRPDTAQLEELDHQVDQLASRADAVNASLDTLRQSQASQGFNLRGDVTASQQRMQRYLAKAQGALQGQDAAGAKKYLDLAETEAANLEKFLGR